MPHRLLTPFMAPVAGSLSRRGPCSAAVAVVGAVVPDDGPGQGDGVGGVDAPAVPSDT